MWSAIWAGWNSKQRSRWIRVCTEANYSILAVSDENERVIIYTGCFKIQPTNSEGVSRHQDDEQLS